MSLSFSDLALSCSFFNFSTYFILYLFPSFQRLSKIILHRDVTIPSFSVDLYPAMPGSPSDPYGILRELLGRWTLIHQKILPIEVLLLPLSSRGSSSLFHSIWCLTLACQIARIVLGKNKCRHFRLYLFRNPIHSLIILFDTCSSSPSLHIDFECIHCCYHFS